MGFSSVVECLPSRRKALGLVLSSGVWWGEEVGGRGKTKEQILRKLQPLADTFTETYHTPFYHAFSDYEESYNIL